MAKKWLKTTLFAFILVILLTSGALLLTSCGKKIQPQSVTIIEQDVEAFLGQKIYLHYDVKPEKSSYATSWSSSNKNIVSVDSSGRITAKNYGEAVITLSLKGTDISASCNVKVTDGFIARVEVDTLNMKLFYYEGEKIEVSDFPVVGYYQSGKKVKLSPDQYTIAYPEYATKGCSVTINYGDSRSHKIDLFVLDDKPVSIEVKSQPNKTSYFVYETFDPSGLEIELVYASKKRELISDYSYSNKPLQYQQESVTINYSTFTTEIPITVNVKTSVTSLSALQQEIDKGTDSIMLTGYHNTPSPITINNKNNITIVGNGKTEINGYNALPIKIIGNAMNIRFVNINLSSIGETPKESQIDLSECTGGNVVFKNVHFASTQNLALILPKDIDLDITFNNCTFGDN